MRVGHATAIAIAAASASVGCARSTPRPGVAAAPAALTEREIELGGLYFELKTGPSGVEIVNTTDDLALLEEGNRLLSIDRDNAAIQTYQRLLELFPRSPFAAAARFNAALARERRGDLTAAARDYRALVDRGAVFATDARLRLAAIATDAGDGDAAVAALAPIDETEVGGVQWLELMSRRGAALVVAGDLDRAQVILDRAYTVAKSPLSATFRHRAYFWAMAGYWRGALEVARMSAIAVADVDSLARAESRRAAAVDRFGEVIDAGDPVWTTRAVHDAAAAHARLADKVEGDTPASGDAERAERAELAAPLRARAVDLHRQNLAFAAAAGVDTEWSRRSAAVVASGGGAAGHI